MIYGALPAPPRFLAEAEVLSLHEASIDLYGGASGIRDIGLLRSALAMPPQGFAMQYAHAVPFEMAAAYAFHLCKNHPFFDGNKRVALAACTVFLFLNGWELDADEIVLADQILAIAEGTLDKAGFAAWVESHARARPHIELRAFFASLTLAQIEAYIESTNRSPSPGSEYVSTAQAAMTAIPALAGLEDLKFQAIGEKNEQVADCIQGMMTSLMAVYRVAEDMGYEW